MWNLARFDVVQVVLVDDIVDIKGLNVSKAFVDGDAVFGGDSNSEFIWFNDSGLCYCRCNLSISNSLS